MITDYTPDTENVCEMFFDKCCHPTLDNGFCENCQSHPSKHDLKMIDDLAKGLSSSGLDICGGILIGKLLHFLMDNSEITYSNKDKLFRHSICMRIYHNDGGFSEFFSKGTQSFAYQVCWLSEILFRIMVGKGAKETDLRRMING